MRIYAESLEKDKLAAYESTHFLGNGYLGVRSCFEEGYPQQYWTSQVTLLNGFHDTHPIAYGEKAYGFAEENETLVPVLDAQTTEIYINDEKFSLFSGKIQKYERYLDLERGVHVRHVIWKSKSGIHVSIRWTRMVSFHYRHLFSTRIEVENLGSEGIEILLKSKVHKGKQTQSADFDPRVAQNNIELQNIQYDEEHQIFCADSEYSGLSMYLGFQCSHDTQMSREEDDVWTFSTTTQNRICYEKRLIYSDSRYHDMDQFIKLAEEYAALNMNECECWQHHDVEHMFRNLHKIAIDDDKKDVICHNLFAIYQSLGRDPHLNISAKGLSGLGYEGHYFWDSEIYVFPVLLKLNPELARIMVEFRVRMLPSALKRSRELGYEKGALYPWRTITGKECSGFFEAGTAQHHISGDVAYAAISYYEKTKDEEFLYHGILEMLYECARLWLEIGFFDEEGKFHIDMVTGPDEYSALVCDNYYTNRLAAYNMKKVVRYAEMAIQQNRSLDFAMDEKELDTMRRAADHMAFTQEHGITGQDRDFLKKKKLDIHRMERDKFPLLLHYHPLFIYRHQVCKQADVILAHYLFYDPEYKEQMKRDILYYDDVTTHDSSLSYSIFAIMYRRLGMREKSEEYSRRNMYLDLHDLHGNTRDGVHIASMAGSLLYLLDDVE